MRNERMGAEGGGAQWGVLERAERMTRDANGSPWSRDA